MTISMTASGKSINLRAIDVDKICIRDVAFSLSNINRFAGHAMRPISVAEHSLMVCQIMEMHFGIRSPAVLLAALLHDSHEYLVGDVTQPVKQLIGSAWKAEEDRIQRVVLKHFKCWTAFSVSHALIHDADMHALSSEREQLMHPDGEVWPCQITHPAIDWVKYSASQFTAEDWRQMFVDKYNELRFAIAQAHASIPVIQTEPTTCN